MDTLDLTNNLPIPNQNNSNKQNNRRLIILISILLIALLCLGGVYYYYLNQKNIKINVMVTNTPSITVSQELTNTPTASPTPTPLLPTGTIVVSNGVQTYTGHGITFNVLTSLDNEPINVKEVGDKVYVYQGSDYSTGSFVEVFSKNSSGSMDQAITKAVLSGFNPTDCPISDQQVAAKQIIGIQTAIITYSSNNIGASGTAPINASKCPKAYTGIHTSTLYFQYESAHPNTLLFFSIGNGGYPATSNIPDSTLWYQNLKLAN